MECKEYFEMKLIYLEEDYKNVEEMIDIIMNEGAGLDDENISKLIDDREIILYEVAYCMDKLGIELQIPNKRMGL